MALLTNEGYEVATATSFKEAQASLVSIRPDLLVAAVRLGAFNGIGLALRAQLNQAKLAVVITDAAHDVAKPCAWGPHTSSTRSRTPRFWRT
jgi:DNA-binding response OmpR family regulator